jgi:glycosyltransferase involved in cell wall biosynthesis
MPNVLQLLDSFNQGGTEWQIVQLTKLLQASGKYRIFLAALSGEGPLRTEVERLGYRDIPTFPLQNFYNVNALKQQSRLVSFIREKEIHLVHAHDFYTNIFGMAAATLAGVSARIASRRETEGIRSQAKRWVERRAFNSAKVVVANAEAIRQQLIGEGLAPEKVITIHNGIDVARIAPQPEERRSELVESFGLPQSRRFVTIVANMRHVMKDQATFLRAAKLTHDAVPDSAFVLAGEGEQVEGLRQLAKDLGIADAAFFVGRCSRVSDLLAISDVCVLSSKGVEGFSNSILEYMAAARPVVATDVGGAREAVVEGETGYIVRPEDFETMAQRITALLREPERARVMGAQGRKRAEEQFSCEAQLRRVEEVYGTLL